MRGVRSERMELLWRDCLGDEGLGPVFEVTVRAVEVGEDGVLATEEGGDAYRMIEGYNWGGTADVVLVLLEVAAALVDISPLRDAAPELVLLAPPGVCPGMRTLSSVCLRSTVGSGTYTFAGMSSLRLK